MTEETIKITKCNAGHLEQLVELGRSTYFDTFKDYCSEEVMNAYLEEAFERNNVHQEILNQESEFYFVHVVGEISGYLKLNVGHAQSDIKSDNSLEIQRIYIKEQYKSRGLGQLMMNHGLERAKQLMKSFVWLGVWEKNLAAIDFYKKNGFHIIGSHDFIMGDEVQNDFIMKKALSKQVSL